MESTNSEDNVTITCNCKIYQKRLEKLQKKYLSLKKHHKKILDVTVLLTEALEQIIKGEEASEIKEILSYCSATYPDLFENLTTNRVEEKEKQTPQIGQMVDENGKVYDPATESEKEYYEGFLARPRIPRTPLV